MMDEREIDGGLSSRAPPVLTLPVLAPKLTRPLSGGWARTAPIARIAFKRLTRSGVEQPPRRHEGSPLGWISLVPPIGRRV